MSVHITHDLYRSDADENRRAVIVGRLIATSREHIQRAMYAAGRAGDDRERERLARLLDDDTGA